MNKVILMGTLVADPEVRTTTSGKSACEFRIAVRRNYKNPQGEYESDFLRCKTFGTTADIVSKYFAKGSRILVEGSIQTSSWDKGDGSKGFSTDIFVNGVEFIDRRGDAADMPPPKQGSKKAASVPNNFTPVDDDDQLPF